MPQRLILPINRTKLTASMKTQAYQKRFGFVHYGIDLISAVGDRALYASGDGVVLESGTDNIVGNVLVILYPDACNRLLDNSCSVVFRYYHLERTAVAQGERVDKNTRIGVYGNTGAMKMGYHLHLEADTDQKHALYSPTVYNSSFLKGRIVGANSRTMSSPLDWLHCKSSPPDSQTYFTAGDSFIRPEDNQIGLIT